MLKTIKRQKQHFNPYYHHNFIMIQFIVIEFINIIQISQSLNQSQITPSRILHQLLESLTKLKDHCSQHLVNSENDQFCLNLNESAQQIWLNIIQRINSLDPPSSAEKFNTVLNQKIKSISAYILVLLKQYRENKPVMFFLLTKKVQLENIYGPNFFSELAASCEFKKDQVLFHKLLDQQHTHKI